jgi:para-aminobenzoate synthetase/4-amino-4-deoxychorismate lyase
MGLFTSPVRYITASGLSDVRRAVEDIQRAASDGFYCAGLIAYEAAPAFDPALKTLPPAPGLPLLKFAVYKSFAPLDAVPDPLAVVSPVGGDVKPEIDEVCYTDEIRKIKQYITNGDIYQANFTYRASAEIRETPASFFLRLASCHPVPFAAFFNFGDIQIASLSPELFLERLGADITTRPMKGTAPREADSDADLAAASALASDPKNRAENIMITDMARNDLGKICVFGSVKAPELFHVETYRTCHQMTSSVSGKLRGTPSLFEILAAAFPAASITGAPKVRATEIIRECEKSPRGVYCGAIGVVTPSMDMLFNVAIRTVVFRNGRAELGVGGGIVADSEPDSEWRESLTKSRFAFFREPDFETLETMLWKRDSGFLWLEEHLDRARKTQNYFGRTWDESGARRALAKNQNDLESAAEISAARARVLFSKQGVPKITFTPLSATGWPPGPVRLKIADTQTSPGDSFLTHKTSFRPLYDKAFHDAQAEGFGEVIFTNSKGELTEGAISNIFVKINGKWKTPPAACGLLPGIWRAKKIAELNASEEPLSRESLKAAEEILLGNSVRGAAPAKLA